MIYFDNSATTFPDLDIMEIYTDTAIKYFANPSSAHRLGAKASIILEQARKRAADCLGVQDNEIVFTSGGTESNNMALKGLAGKAKKGHIITSVIEHASIFETCKQLEQSGFDVTYVETDSSGHIAVEDVYNAIRPDTIAVSVMYVNSELGSIQPIQQIGQLLKDYSQIVFHVDAVQGLGKLPLWPKDWGVDMLSLSSHKFHSPRGVGLLYVREGIEIDPLLVGGGQERTIRSSTENVAGIVAMSHAMEKQMDMLEENIGYLSELRNRLLEGLSKLPGIQLNSSKEDGAPHIINFSNIYMSSEDLLQALEKRQIYISKSSACSSKSHKPSRVLLATGMDEERASRAVRVSLSHCNTLAEIDFFLIALQQILSKLVYS
ncbi:cysteine desulfurase family protein [Priestia flexa]|uniref:cysteine desulfurase family protein n=1 Tax=Priestia flexa TaxID=86664 RepID=UPI001B324ABD|nr:cysteine desulfurase family protein [Priestia flexa]